MNDDRMTARWWTVSEIAEVVAVSRMTIYRMVHSGAIPSLRIGRTIRVRDEVVQDVLTRGVAGYGVAERK